ncbi:MAG: tetratricopeptide repeat protein, partial [Acidobacteria bacterium]|nr:tetratricopeptide repeat protein [Acidobacteriota bacterium]
MLKVLVMRFSVLLFAFFICGQFLWGAEEVPRAKRQGTQSMDYQAVSEAAQRAWEARQFDEAARLYAEGVNLNRKWVEGWGRLAACLYNLGRYAEAIDAYRQTAQLGPANPASWAYLGLCEYQVRRYPAAFEHLRKAEQIGLPPDRDLTAEVKYDMAVLWDTAGKFTEGLNEISWFPQQNLGSDEILLVIGLSIMQRPWFPY